jgi:hypothetical protein
MNRMSMTLFKRPYLPPHHSNVAESSQTPSAKR